MEPHLSMEIGEIDKNKKYQVVKFDGEFDKPGHSAVKDELEDFIKNFEGSNIVFDFKKLKFINSEGIGYLMEIHTHLVKDDKQLVVVSLNAHVKDVFETIGMSEIIPIHKNIEDFLKSN